MNRADVLMQIGDFNAKMGERGTESEACMGNHGLGPRNENGDLFTEVCSAFDLLISGIIFPHRDVHKITWTSPDGRIKNQIDHIAFSRRWRESFLNVRNRRGADVGSDY